jgi:hypothetical protein
MVLFVNTFVQMYTNHVMNNIKAIAKENIELRAQNHALRMAYCEFYPSMTLALYELKDHKDFKE